MNGDAFFAIGSRHAAQGAPCEDYAFAGALDSPAGGLLWAAVADGCSGAWASTDVGARSLVHAFEHSLSRRAGSASDWFENGFLADLADAVRARRITPRGADYYSTLVAMAANARRAEVLILGDGVVATCFKDGRCRLRWTEWPQNAPYYFAYRLDPAENAAYLERYGGDVLEHVVEFETARPEVAAETRTVLPPAAYLEGQRLSFDAEREQLAGIALFTDGLAQIGEMPLERAARACLAFKTFRGSFVKRRLIHALKSFAKEGAPVRDDLAAAAIWYADADAAG